MATEDEPQVITTLRGTVTKVREGCGPDLAFLALWRDSPVSVGMPPKEWFEEKDPSGTGGMVLEIESFVRMKILSPGLQAAIREELRIRHEQGLPIYNKEWAEFTRTKMG
jgi:hypothetical protein